MLPKIAGRAGGSGIGTRGAESRTKSRQMPMKTRCAISITTTQRRWRRNGKLFVIASAVGCKASHVVSNYQVAKLARRNYQPFRSTHEMRACLTQPQWVEVAGRINTFNHESPFQ